MTAVVAPPNLCLMPKGPPSATCATSAKGANPRPSLGSERRSAALGAA